jgi:enoyl-CoA hydratase/carnithine racemase
MDRAVHRFPKPVVVLAHGVTMGGGIGIAAGADAVVATKSTRMAMPESRIGFFPDVGATGWLFAKCPVGYPEFLGLTGYEVRGGDCVRLGLATHLVGQESLLDLLDRLQQLDPGRLPSDPQALRAFLAGELERFADHEIPAAPDLDAWVREYFAGQQSVQAVRDGLASCSLQQDLCRFVFSEFTSRSPTALVLTLFLLRRNEKRPLEEVFEADLQAARFMLSHHDFLEGVRARLLDKDNDPKWDPAEIEAVDLQGLDL